MRTDNVFVIALDDFNREMLEQLRGHENTRFHSLLDLETAVDTRHYDIPSLIERGRKQLRDFEGSVDAVVGYWDFPTCLLLPVFRNDYNLPGPSLEAALRCEHKYWTRVEEAKVAPNATPRFAAFDPFDEDVLEDPPLPYPFWMKPICSHSSQLGFRIDNREDFEQAICETRANLDFVAAPLNEFLKMVDLPDEVVHVTGWHCLAEEIISEGRQCTVEGYVLDGDVRIYGIVDSKREGAKGSSFSRYEYPSQLPEHVCDRMFWDSRRLLKQVGYDNAPFNIEFFYNEADESLYLLEVNTRCSKSHSPLFRMVDGASNLQAMVDVGLGRWPDFPPEGGEYAYASKVMLREDRDARVERVPTPEEVAAIERDFPGVRIQIEAAEGEKLSSMLHQDSYTFEIATLFVGGQSPAEIDEKTEAVKKRLDFRLRR